jgi:hypothetical protein
MMFACSAFLVDVASIAPSVAAPGVTIAMPRVSRAATRQRAVMPRRSGARRLAIVAAPIAS